MIFRKSHQLAKVSKKYASTASNHKNLAKCNHEKNVFLKRLKQTFKRRLNPSFDTISINIHTHPFPFTF